MSSIQVFKPFYRTEEVLSEIRQCLEKSWTGIGYKTIEFEESWKEYSGFKYCHFLNSATSGLHLAFKIFKDAYGWKDDDQVITTSLTFVSTNHAILYEKLCPVFADVDSSLCLDPKSVERMITEKTKAVIYVGIGGNAANYDQIKQICERYNLILILDAAHMSGTRSRITGEHIGLDSDCTVFSYQAVKNCPISDAGSICFKDESFDKAARSLSWLGIDKSTYSRFSDQSYKWRYNVENLGYKYHGNSIMAAIGLVSLKYLEADNARRREIAAMYSDSLSNFKGIEVISHDPNIVSSRHLFQIAVENRDSLIENLTTNSIYCGVHYIDNTSYPLYKHFNSDLNVSKYYSDRLLSLPLHLHLSDSDVKKIVQSIQSAVVNNPV